MARPILHWSWECLPANSDIVKMIGKQPMPDGKELFMYYNDTRKQLFFEYDGNYGVIVKGED